MFTGIIEDLGVVSDIKKNQNNHIYTIESSISSALKIDQSIAHNGVCLTVIEVGEGHHQVEAIQETLEKSNAGNWSIGDRLNLERCMKADGRFDGHIVQGHIDCTAHCTAIEDQKGSYLVSFEYENPEWITVEKGSICINGISLTVVNSKSKGFSVALIPYTWEHTNMKDLAIGSTVNLEFDILGKYIQKLMNRNA